MLGLGADPTTEQIESARRSLAKSAHPDVGGSLPEMQRINAAADEATRILAGRGLAAGREPTTSTPATRTTGPPPIVRYDNPSFTIEALPAASFEALLIVAGTLGDVIDDDPPYRLEVALAAPISGWCRLDLMPEAGASTVALTVAGEPGAGPPDLDAVRDAWIAELNQLDWTGL